MSNIPHNWSVVIPGHRLTVSQPSFGLPESPERNLLLRGCQGLAVPKMLGAALPGFCQACINGAALPLLQTPFRFILVSCGQVWIL